MSQSKGSAEPVSARAEGEETRRHLLDAAERLFASHGVDAVSVRTINSEAGVAPASTHYHFGGKDRLLDAVLLRRGERVMAEVDEQCAALLARPTPPQPRELVEILARPIIQMIERETSGGVLWSRIVAQLSISGDHRLLEMSRDTNARLAEAVARAYPDAPPDVRRVCWTMAALTVLQLLGNAGTVALPGPDGVEAMQAYVDLVVDFAAHGLEASMGAVRRRTQHSHFSEGGGDV